MSSTGVESNIYREWYLVNNVKPTFEVLAGGENIPLTTFSTGTAELYLLAKSPIAHFGLEYSVNSSSYQPLPANGKISRAVTSGNNNIKIGVKDKVGNVSYKTINLMGI